MKNKQISRIINVFHEIMAPEPGKLAGYGALIDFLGLPLPVPGQIALISEKHRQYTNEEWKVFTPRYQPKETIYDHLAFALKYEGINLLFFKKFFEKTDTKDLKKWITAEPLSQYSRRIWFLYEWLMQKQLSVPDLKEGGYVELIDTKLQYASSKSINSSRHRIKNNLPGSVKFCPLIYKTEKLENYITQNLSEKTNELISGVHKDILQRTAAFLLLKDSKASFQIENENPGPNRAARWGRAIGQAGGKSLSKEELLRLQQIVIENSRFVTMGYRTQGGFVGEYDRITHEPIPDHISARWQDLEVLMTGLIQTAEKLETSSFHPVLTAASIAFGFVFIHPFEDGNGRIHRYLIHHILASMKFTPQGIIFPVSAAILDKIDDYRKVLESYSLPLLEFIKWRKTPENNVEVINETADYYSYFDATKQAEFLFDCVDYTINKIIPEEVTWLRNYDAMKNWLDDRFEMPDKMISLLISFLGQNNGVFSQRAKDKEFAKLTEEEIREIEKTYKSIFNK